MLGLFNILFSYCVKVSVGTNGIRGKAGRCKVEWGVITELADVGIYQPLA